jgi:hypothetical protein
MIRVLSYLALVAIFAGACAPAGERDEVEPLGSLEGEFSCTAYPPDTDTFDLGPAWFAGNIAKQRYAKNLRTQGCFARIRDTDEGRIASAILIQQKDYEKAQVLELNVPLEGLTRGMDVEFFGADGGFGSMYLLTEPGAAPDVFLRTTGGIVTITSVARQRGQVLEGLFTDLRLGDL